MSVAGIFPPICDYRDGHLLVDGCYVNNVPGIQYFVIIILIETKKYKTRKLWHTLHELVYVTMNTVLLEMFRFFYNLQVNFLCVRVLHELINEMESHNYFFTCS